MSREIELNLARGEVEAAAVDVDGYVAGLVDPVVHEFRDKLRDAIKEEREAFDMPPSSRRPEHPCSVDPRPANVNACEDYVDALVEGHPRGLVPLGFRLKFRNALYRERGARRTFWVLKYKFRLLARTYG